MGWFKKRTDKTLPSDNYSSASDYYAALRKGLREKADHNKNESQWFFTLAIGCTLVAPLFVTLGEGVVLGKVIPASLSVLAAGFTSWLQLRKPQRLWSIYRRAQRELEREKSQYDFKLGDYGPDVDRDKLLAQRVTDIAFKVHEQWEGLIPEADALISIGAPKPTEAANGN